MLESRDFSELLPVFDDARHASICSEVCTGKPFTLYTSFLTTMQMKSLYVAITRARQNVWILDDSPKGEPMRVRVLYRQ